MDVTKINYRPLFDKIEECLGVQLAMSMDFTGRNPGIKCENLAEHCGAMKSVFTEVEVGVFSGNIGHETLWLNINMSWKQTGGGSNGTTLFDAFFNYEKCGWIFKFPGK
jgi:hypothetical protein